MLETKDQRGAGGQTVWNTQAVATSFAGIASENLDALARRVFEEVRGLVDDRVRPYQTSETMETLHMPIP